MDTLTMSTTSTNNAAASTASATTSTTSNAGKNSTADSAGKTAAAGTEATFTQVLGGQMTKAAPADESTDAALALAGLLQMLQGITLPAQLVVQNQEGIAPDPNQVLPNLLLQAMNSNEGLADALLQDPNIQQWFQQAQEILSSLSGQAAGGSTAFSSHLNAADSQSLAAQNTLLALNSMLQKNPDNVILQFLAQDLQKVIQPVLPLLTAQAASLSLDLTGQAVADSLATAGSKASEAGLLSQGTAAKHTEGQGSSKDTISKHDRKLLDGDQAEKVVVQPAAKSKLELLAAKSAVNAPMFTMHAAPEETAKVTAEVNVASNVNDNTATVQVSPDQIKAPVQTESLTKAAPQTFTSANFAEEMTKHVVKNMKITLAEGLSEAKLSLFPRNLGHVDVKISLHEGQLVAHFAADTLAGKQMLESQLPLLRQSLLNQGLQVEKLEVTHNENTQSGMFQDQRNQQSFNQSLRQNKQSAMNYELEGTEFIQELSAADESKPALYGGNSFDVTA
ncbi:flagellar hook-length control protein FliK [Paenibacillus eucommiae]|uniref:Flagellar hook-length control protein FliK n=1 Tax=Paenibacillus eucommiae TaxID=1355755 RepID=A0ABS4IUS9_9BACL|nr:flagellar hook-length control protein FliK [Paenibacillus eucommiae]MBP1991335.1 flagellar hook-length control protein FliK [Paenibacillus eucommiae]